MIRTLAAASAQTWGQPVYLNAWGRSVGGSPLSEVETRSYGGTGRWADGYSERPQVYVPAPGYDSAYGRGHGQGRDGRARHGHGHHRGYGAHGQRRHEPSSQSGYRDEWGYNDDRPPSARRWSDDGRSRSRDRDCGCDDVYLYDR